MTTESVSANGRSAQIGELYNIHNDEFYKISVIETSQLPDEILTKFDSSHVHIRFAPTSSLKQNFNSNAKKTTDELNGIVVMKCSLYYKRQTKQEQICSYKLLKKYVNLEVLKFCPMATHIVSGINWGAILSCDYEYEDRPEYSCTVEANEKENRKVTSFEVSGDFDIDKTKPTFEEINEFISDIHRRVQELNGGKGNPTEYTVLPLDHFIRRMEN